MEAREAEAREAEAREAEAREAEAREAEQGRRRQGRRRQGRRRQGRRRQGRRRQGRRRQERRRQERRKATPGHNKTRGEMKMNNSFLVWSGLLVCVFLSACAHVSPYTSQAPMPEEGLIVAGAALADWDPGIADQVSATSRRCIQIKAALADEIERRESRQRTIRRWLLGIGSGATLLASIYTGIEESPKKTVTTPLTSIGGGLLLTAFPVLTSDDPRIDDLRAKIAAINRRRDVAVLQLLNIERQMVERGILRRRYRRFRKSDNDAAQLPEIAGDIEAIERGVMPLEETVRQSLIEWGNECN